MIQVTRMFQVMLRMLSLSMMSPRLLARRCAARRLLARRCAARRLHGRRLHGRRRAGSDLSRLARLGLPAAALGALLACSPVQDVRSILDTDLYPPRLFGVEMVSETDLELTFDKDVTIAADSLVVEGDNATRVDVVDDGGTTVRLRLDAESSPGIRYAVGGAAEDAHGNSLQFVVYAYGFNDRMPEVQINEFNTRRSGNHPEIVELFVLEAGNIGGMTVTNGTVSDFNSRYIFPSVEVAAGEYILVHFRPEGTSDEVDELGDELDLSGGLNAHDEARDVWVGDGSGLPGNNGVVAVWKHPGGSPIDAVPYTNRTSESDERYHGFGSRRTQEWVDEIVEAGAWVIEGAYPRPEDLVWIDESTATRSVNRTPGAANTRSKADWHTVPTSGSTWGYENTTDVHEP